jgi:predicted nucleic acid-binding protein
MPTVSNTSPIFNLACIERLNLLHEQFGQVWIPNAVEAELRHVPDSTVRKMIEQARRTGWLKQRPASNAPLVALLTLELHQGEAEAIALALEMNADHVLIDERDGRILARQLALRLTGVLGVLLRGKMVGRLESIKSEIEALRAKAHFFIAPELEAAVLTKAGE